MGPKVFQRRDMWLWLGFVVMALLPLFIEFEFFFYLVDLMIIYSIIVIGLDLAMGYTGQVSLGHAAFFGIGAYTTAILTGEVGLSFWLTIPVAAVLAAMFGIVVGLTAPRLHEEYLVMSTLAFNTIAFLVFLNWRDLTGGPMGLPGLPSPRLSVPGIGIYEFREYHSFFWLLLPLFALTIFITRRIVNSRYGAACRAIREDEIAAEALGVNLTWQKVSVFALSALYGGVAGAFFALFLGVVSPESFKISTSITLLSMSMIGGMGSIAGSILGVVALTLFSEATRDYPVYSLMTYGFLLTTMIIFFPYGIAGLIQRFFARWQRSRLHRNAAEIS